MSAPAAPRPTEPAPPPEPDALAAAVYGDRPEAHIVDTAAHYVASVTMTPLFALCGEPVDVADDTVGDEYEGPTCVACIEVAEREGRSL